MIQNWQWCHDASWPQEKTGHEGDVVFPYHSSLEAFVCHSKDNKIDEVACGRSSE